MGVGVVVVELVRERHYGIAEVRIRYTVRVPNIRVKPQESIRMT